MRPCGPTVDASDGGTNPVRNLLKRQEAFLIASDFLEQPRIRETQEQTLLATLGNYLEQKVTIKEP